MIGGSLFQRFFWRYLATLVLAIGMLIFITHWYQAKHSQQQFKQLKQNAVTWQSSWSSGDLEQQMDHWRQQSDSARLMLVKDGQLMADSHPEHGPHAWEFFKVHERLNDEMTLVLPLGNGYQAVFAKPFTLRLPFDLPASGLLVHSPLWRLVAILLMIAVLISLLLYPLVRGLSRTFLDLGHLAEQVAAGHFGKTLVVARKDELGGLVGAFNHMSRRLAEAEQLNTRLIHDVSHELRSPLGRIKVLADTLQYRPQDAPACVEEIHREVALLDRMVEDMIAAAKMEVSCESLHWETFDLVDWASSLQQRMAKLIKSWQVRFDFKPPTPGNSVQGDRQRLTQAVGNLVENALRAVELVENPQIHLAIQVDQDAWRIQVSDNGVGISEQDLPHIYRRFYRVDKHRDRDDGGVGLGLSIVKAIVESHRGEISLESKPGSGTQVTIMLPLKEAASA